MRALCLKDAPLMLEWMGDPAINKFFRFDAKNATVSSVESYIRTSWEEKTNLHLACVDENDEYLGTVSLKNIDSDNKNAEFATSFRASAQGSGAAAQAARQLLARGFDELSLHRIYLNVLEDNGRAIAFYEKLGFVREGVFRKHLVLNGIARDLVVYGMLYGELNEQFK
ncbi:MAG: GNAT family protein [Oscillospiraceae bacterium]